MPTQEENQFHQAMVDLYHRAKDEAGYNATRYLQMVANNGGVETTRNLINSDAPADGYTELYLQGRLDLTVEALVVENEQWQSLFDPAEIEKARQRLKEYWYNPRAP
mgnify:CR=1 FL=1